MSPSSIISIILSFVLLISVANANVDETCKNAIASNSSINYGFCATSLRTNPRSETANAHDLALIATQLCVNNATGTQIKINSLTANKNLSQKVKDILKLCSGAYNNQLTLLNGAVDSFNKANYADAISKVDTVKQRAYDCNDLFFEGGENDLLAKDESHLDGLSTIALFLVKRL